MLNNKSMLDIKKIKQQNNGKTFINICVEEKH